jgi:hypothetical protein
MIDLYLIYGGLLLLTIMQIVAILQINQLWRVKKNVSGVTNKRNEFQFSRYGKKIKGVMQRLYKP